ncbi:tetratricopeptide repeat protein [Sorangium sp. So ce1024]|uniref:tetratricopeptide repeat protein n=1 Tax=unclassified Sorangium TaxID=2621164 RepID=UPI003F0ADF9A
MRIHSNRTAPTRRSPLAVRLGGLLAATLLAACSTTLGPGAARPPAAEKWLARARQEFQSADVDNARDAVAKALTIVPTDTEARLLAGRIALARLDYAEVLRLLKGVSGSEAAGIRGRALWYKGDLDAAADELEAMLDDPDVVDEWAKSIAKLARRGAGRAPFTISGALLAAIEMPHVSPAAPFFVVPLEIDGESALAMVSTGTGEVVLDSSTRKEPSWVSLRFGKKLEVNDVPALTQDLSGISKQMGAPIKALLGVNLLRHLNATIDYSGRQFVVRSFSPPAPPDATRVDLAFIKGGGMVLRSSVGPDKTLQGPMLVDTSMTFPIALDKEGWKKAGFEADGLKRVEQDPEQKLKQGVVPMLRLGALEIPKVPGVYGAPLQAVEKQLQLDLDGVIGAGLLAYFRITFGDGGRLMWIEDDVALNRVLQGGEPPPAPAGDGQAPGPAGEAGSPAPGAPAPAAPAPQAPAAPAPPAAAPAPGSAPPAGAPRRTPDR